MEAENILPAGTRIRLRSDPGRTGVLTGTNRLQAGIRKYQVSFPEIRSYQPEYELEVIDDDNSDWAKLVSDGRFGLVRDLRRNLTYIHLSGRLANLVYSMDTTNTDFYPYQFKPVLSFLDSPSNGLLIADEVGLGKTIEAGLIWTELRARYDARRLLVVCPAMLREKWCSELSHRFGVEADILDAGQLLENLKKDKHEIPDGKAYVCSLQGLRPSKQWKDSEATTQPNARDQLARFLDMKSVEESLIDLVIFDEAHYLRNPETQGANLAQLVRAVSEGVVLLSATPINLKDDDLYHLLNLVDPDSFGTREVFPQVLAANEPLQKAMRLTLDIRTSAEEIKEQLKIAQDHPLLQNSRQLAELIETSTANATLTHRAERIKLANRIERINLLNHAYTRTRKVEVTEWKVLRVPLKMFVELDPKGEEWKFYQAVTNTVRRYAVEKDICEGFLLAGPQRQVSSCMYAAALAWQNKLYSFEEQLYEDFGYDEALPAGYSPLIERICNEVLPDIDLPALKNYDSKYNVFKRMVTSFLKDNPSEKIIVFSFFRNTLAYLGARLSEEGVNSQILVGGMNESKQAIIDRFRESNSTRVLLSSEVASEGVDLQFCRVLVNYDLPWNPMKVEQRIGRIDRIGQKAEKIDIINLLYAGTIDHKIHDKLYERLKIFERALGGMEAILGEEIKELTSALLSRPLTAEEETKRIEQTAMAIERIRQDQDELERNASHLIAHSGYILDQVQAAHNFKKRITAEDLCIYVKDYLEKYCQGHELRQIADEDMIFWIKLPPSTAAQLATFIQKHKLFGQTSLATGDQVKCHISNKVKDAGKKIEFISQFHPFIRFISQELKEHDEAFYPLVAAEVPANLHPGFISGSYAFFINRWEFSGLKIEEELPVRAFHLDTHDLLDLDSSWSLVNMARVDGKNWLEAQSVINLDEVIAGLDECSYAIEKDFQEARLQRDNENFDRVSFQIDSAGRHKDRQLRSLYEVLRRYQESGNIRMIPATKGRILKVEERFHIQVERLKNKSKLTSAQFEVCCGIINLA